MNEAYLTLPYSKSFSSGVFRHISVITIFSKETTFISLKTGIILGGLSSAWLTLPTPMLTADSPSSGSIINSHRRLSTTITTSFGYICGTAFVFLLSDYLTESKTNKMSLLLMPMQFMGVLLSTSRGALLAMIVVTIVLIGKALMSKTHGKRASTL